MLLNRFIYHKPFIVTIITIELNQVLLVVLAPTNNHVHQTHGVVIVQCGEAHLCQTKPAAEWASHVYSRRKAGQGHLHVKAAVGMSWHMVLSARTVENCYHEQKSSQGGFYVRRAAPIPHASDTYILNTTVSRAQVKRTMSTVIPFHK